MCPNFIFGGYHLTEETTRKQELMDKAYTLGFEYEKTYKGCAQCAFAALQDALGKRNAETDAIFQSLTGMAGGGAREGDGSCGAYVGASAFFGYILGRSRDDFADPAKIRLKTFAMVKKLHDKFVDKYGTPVCHPIHRKLYGRPFYIADADEFAKFEAAGAHDSGCTGVVGDTARWAVEILADEGLVP